MEEPECNDQSSGWEASKKWFLQTVSISCWGAVAAFCNSWDAWLGTRFFLGFNFLGGHIEMCLSWSRKFDRACVISFLISHTRIRVKCQNIQYSENLYFLVVYLVLFCSFGSPYQWCSKYASKFQLLLNSDQCVNVSDDVRGMWWNLAYTVLHLVATPLPIIWH